MIATISESSFITVHNVHKPECFSIERGNYLENLINVYFQIRQRELSYVLPSSRDVISIIQSNVRDRTKESESRAIDTIHSPYEIIHVSYVTAGVSASDPPLAFCYLIIISMSST